MSRKVLQVSVNPAVMKWAKESAGLDAEGVARRLGVSVNTVKGWELGTKKPSLKILEKLASFYKRPLAVFFLPEPPQESPMPVDFRVLPEEQKRPLSKKTRLAIRRARRVQSLATELMKATSHEPVANIEKAYLTEDPEAVATRERDRFGISVERQISWKDKYTAFYRWREAIESLNIVVLQASIPIKEARGFSLLDDLLPTIVVSTSDPVHARIFSLFHEYAHLLLGTSGICNPNEAYDDASTQEVERFCNYFAGAFLVPKYALQEDNDVRLITRQLEVDDRCLAKVSERFKVSKEVILRRMLIPRLISRQQYQSKLAEWQSREEPFKKAQKRPSGGVPTPKRCVLNNGRLFVSFVLEAKEQELITYNDLADYLSIKLKHLDEVEALLYKQK